VALAAAGAPHGVWLRAETQTGGKGRQGRAWLSPPGNLYASTLVRLAPGDPPAPTLALVAAVALDQLVAGHVGEARSQIKWPNDILVDGAKLAGILLERAGDAVVVGFGVNLAGYPGGLDRPATSLAAAEIEPPSPENFLSDLADSCAHWLTRWRNDSEAVRKKWLHRAHPIGTALAIHGPDGKAIHGLFDGLDAGGALKLRLADGSAHVMHAGDVFLI
jgi:BirA family biotin operon repressor/biotin-[acetyl-CoA-carboxylase] ligase